MVVTVDNGSEFYAQTTDGWAYRHGVRLDFSRPGKPMDNPFIESFNGRLGTSISMSSCSSRCQTRGRHSWSGNGTTMRSDRTVRSRSGRRSSRWLDVEGALHSLSVAVFSLVPVDALEGFMLCLERNDAACCASN